MKASAIHVGDQVEVNRGGAFVARVTGALERGWFPIEPVLTGIGYRAATPKQIKRVVESPCAERLPLRGRA
jgi:hypothetical protein